jgi:transposase
MQTQQQIQIRRQKGQEIAKAGNVKLNGNTWIVPSQSCSKTYEVVLGIGNSRCTCPDYIERGMKCKHIFSVEFTITKRNNADGTTTITQTKRITYAQNWNAYNLSQITEKERFMELLQGLIENVPENHREGRGRPQMPIRDLLFASTLKVFSQFSLRRFMTDLRVAKDKGYVDNVPCYSSVGKFMERSDITPILSDLIQQSSLALRSVEVDFAVDSSGFRTTKFNDYCREKHNTKQSHEWLKCHIITGVKTNVITGVEVGFEHHTADSPQFIPLVKATHDIGFTLNEVSGDKAYLSKNNLDAVAEIGGVAYIPFKSNSQQHGRGSRVWNKMYYYFKLCNEEFMQHYHKRSNVETTFFMVKSKFGDMLRSKTKTAQINELLLKILCHNIVVLNSAVNELGVKINFEQA